MAKILIREPSGTMNAVLARQLQKHEISFMLPREAIPGGNFDLVITHLGATNQLTQLTEEFCAEIAERGTSVPIIILTGAPFAVDDRIREMVAAVVEKPLSSFDEFVQTVEQVLGEKG